MSKVRPLLRSDGRYWLTDEDGHADEPYEPDAPALHDAPYARMPCPVCALKLIADPCAVCKRRGDPDSYVPCSHLCQHGVDTAKTGECCFNGEEYE